MLILIHKIPKTPSKNSISRTTGFLAGFCWTGTGVSAQAQSCHLRELDLCAATLLVFVQSPGGLAVNEAEINKQCVHLREADTCLRNFTKRCMTPLQRELINFTANSTYQLMDDYCAKGSAFRSSYLKHASCLNQVQKKEQKNCIRDLQVALEALSSASNGETSKRIHLACCAYRRFDSCMSHQVESKCGKEALQFVRSTVERITSRLPDKFCRNQKPEGQECKTLLPKPGTLPKGSKSSSVISRLVSAYTGL